MRVVGIDYGLKRIGIALSDERQLFASPLCLLEAAASLEATVEALLKQLAPYAPIEKIVVGLPLHMNGKESPLSTQARAFAAKIEALSSFPVLLWDERLTSLQVERTLKEAQLSRKQRARHLDVMAAAAILQNFLDSSSSICLSGGREKTQSFRGEMNRAP